MKKNKTVAYLLAATLLVGGTFAGTKAFFSDQAQAKNDLVITMGDLDVEVKEGNWMKGKEAGRPGSEVISSGENNNIMNNAKPGDGFLKEVTITNNGTLNQEIKITASAKKPGVDESIMKYITVDDKIITSLDKQVIAPGATVKGKILVTLNYINMPGKHNEDGSFNTDKTQTVDFSELGGIFTIDAKQTDAPASIKNPHTPQPR
ncbi:MAG: TasA family protein [Bacilli bacterium]